MKNIFALVFTVLLFSSLQAQDKGDNLIVITTNRFPEENFRQFGRHLISEGYSFESKDADFYTLKTNYTVISAGANYRMNITFIDSMIYIRPEVETRGMDVRARPVLLSWTYSNSKINVFKYAYDHFSPKIRRYNYPVTFKKE